MKATGDYSGAFSKLARYMISHYGGRLAVVAICILIASAGTISASAFLEKIIDDVIVPGLAAGGIDQTEFTRVILMMTGIYSLSIIASFIYARIMAVVTQGLLHAFRTDMFRAMERFPVRFFDTHLFGEIMSRYTNDTDAMREFISRSMPNILTSVLNLTISFVMMLCYSVWLTLVTMAFIVIMALIARFLSKHGAHYFMKQQQDIAAHEGYTQEIINGQKVVKVFCHEQECAEGFSKLNERLFDSASKANGYGNSMMPILMNIGHLIYVFCAFAGALMVVKGARNLTLSGMSSEPVEVGVIIAFLTLSRSLAQSIGQLSMEVPMIIMGLAGSKRVFELIETEPEADNGYVMLVNAKRDENGCLSESEERTGLWAWKHYHKATDTTTYVELKGDLVMEHVDFAYDPEKQVLFDVSIHAEAGQQIAFVGATGAGKTTITNLINRFYDIADGKIRYDGININKIKKSDLRRSLQVVLQDTNLFSGTIMDNIRYGRRDATDEECINAAKLANADDFITRLPDGYNTYISGNGSQLSQGQRQLLSIARAAVADAPAMIMDEATSSIDTRTEALIQDGMEKLMRGRTVFVIAHRLSTIRNSDKIVVLDHGRVIESGTHNELIALKGTYYKLYTGAFELD